MLSVALLFSVALAGEIDYNATSTLRTYASYQAIQHNIDPLLFQKVIECESRWNPKAVGDANSSFGIAQFHNLKDWGMTKEQAYDPYYSITRMSEAWEQGLQNKWSCTKLVK